MRSRLIYQNDDLKTFAVVFDKGDEVRRGLLEFANANRLADAQLSAIGAFSEVTLGYFERNEKIYKEIPIREQVEVLALTGNIVYGDGKPKLHAHVVVGRSDGRAYGGHLLAGKVWPTLEMIVTELPVHLRRRIDGETGLPLIELAA